jgi:hypothetical protein
MWEPRPLTPLWAFTARYRDSFTFTLRPRWRRHACKVYVIFPDFHQNESGSARVPMSQTRLCGAQSWESAHACVVKYIRARLPSQARRAGLVRVWVSLETTFPTPVSMTGPCRAVCANTVYTSTSTDATAYRHQPLSRMYLQIQASTNNSL